LILRYLFGLRGAPLISSAVGTNATRNTSDAIEAYLASILASIDVDGNGSVTALTDGLLMLRYLFGLRGDALIANAVGAGATRDTAAEIESYIASVL
jgi:hypothetical protein